jgi:RNA polymerase sigma factor (sigma-70 family)
MDGCGRQRVARDKAAVSELVRAARAGDSRSWDGLVDEFKAMVFSIARSHRLSAADAADVSQTTWTRLVEHLDRIEQPEYVGAWLATTARRESLRVLRMADRQAPAADDALFDRLVSAAAPVDDDLLAEERDRVVADLLSKLPCRCSRLLRLLLADPPVSYRDLGELLDMPMGSIGPTRARCLEHFRRLAGSAGLMPAEDL